MNYFVIVSLGNDCSGFYRFYIGELSEIAGYLLDESEESFNGVGHNLKELKEEYYCEFDSYIKLKRRKVFFPEELIRSYSFVLSDMYVSTYAMTDSTEEVVNIINDFIEDKEMDYKLKNPSLSEEELCEAFYEIGEIYNGICDTPKYYEKMDE